MSCPKTLATSWPPTCCGPPSTSQRGAARAGRLLVLRSTRHLPASWRQRGLAMAWIWSWRLREPAPGRTRVVRRNRLRLHPGGWSGGSWPRSSRPTSSWPAATCAACGAGPKPPQPSRPPPSQGNLWRRRWSRCWRPSGMLVVARRRQHWAATDEEVVGSLPGDDLIPGGQAGLDPRDHHPCPCPAGMAVASPDGATKAARHVPLRRLERRSAPATSTGTTSAGRQQEPRRYLG